MKADLPWRRFRYIEVLSEADLDHPPDEWPLIEGWLEKAESMLPGSPKGLVGSKGLITLPGGARFSEVSFKSKYEILDFALPTWSAEVGRRWAKVIGDTLVLSDGTRWSRGEIHVEGHPHAEIDASALPWLADIKRKSEEELNKVAEPGATDNPEDAQRI